MENWIDLSGIPKAKKHGQVGYDWENSIGCSCDFGCQDILGQLKIVDYDVKKRVITVSYNDNLKRIDIGSFKKAQLRSVVGKRTKDFKVNIGETFTNNKRNLTIIDRKMIPDSKGKIKKNV